MELRQRLESALADHQITAKEAQTLVAAAGGSRATLAKAIQSATGADPDTAIPLALNIEVAARQKATFDVDGMTFRDSVTGGQLVTERLDSTREILAGVCSEEFDYTADVFRYDKQQSLTSWGAFPAFLRELRQQQAADPEHRHVTLNLSTHGNGGTCFKLSTVGADGQELVSVASAAWINQQLAQAGFKPGDISIVSEACNAGSSYLTTVDGFNDDELNRIETMASGHQRSEAKGHRIEVFDAAPGSSIPRDFAWVGRPEGANRVRSVQLQYIAGTALPGPASLMAGKHQGAVPGFTLLPGERLTLLNTLPPGGAHFSEHLVESTDSALEVITDRAHGLDAGHVRSSADYAAARAGSSKSSSPAPAPSAPDEPARTPPPGPTPMAPDNPVNPTLSGPTPSAPAGAAPPMTRRKTRDTVGA